MKDKKLHSKLDEIIELLKEIRDKQYPYPIVVNPTYWPPQTSWINYTYQSPPETSGGHQQ